MPLSSGGTLQFIAPIIGPTVIAKILTHLGLPARAHLDHRRNSTDSKTASPDVLNLALLLLSVPVPR